MILSLERQFLFVHNPKTAGTAMAEVLERHVADPRRLWFNRALARAGVRANRWLGPPAWRVFRIHDPALVPCRALPARLYARLFKFAFVRNPFDLFDSLYRFARSSPTHHRRDYWQRRSFAEFVEFEIARNRRVQYRALSNAHGELIVDFVGRFENVASDFATALERIGLEGALPAEENVRRRDYREAYDSPTGRLLRNKIARHAAIDLDRFGYAFDPPASALAARPLRLAA